MTEELLTIPETAARLKVSRATVYKMLDRGDIRAVKFGRCRRVLATSIDALVQRVQGSV